MQSQNSACLTSALATHTEQRDEELNPEEKQDLTQICMCIWTLPNDFSAEELPEFSRRKPQIRS